MSDEIIIKCQECGTEIPADKNKLPCPKCDGLKRHYEANLNTALGLKVTKLHNTKNIVSTILIILLILSAIASYVISTFIPKWNKDIVYWIFIALGTVSMIFAFIFGIIQDQYLKNITQRQFNFKSLDDWIDILRQPVIILLALFITLYILLHNINKAKMPLTLDFIILATGFGGFVLAAGQFGKKEQLIQIAKLFIFATVLLMSFTLAFMILTVLNFNPTVFQPTYNWVINEIIFIVLVVGGLFGGAYLFSQAVIDLIIVLRKIK